MEQKKDNKILIHACCGICSGYPISMLKEMRYEPVVYFCNPNLDTKEEFETFMSQLKETNATLAFYSDFKKIAKNVNDIAISLNMLNFLLGKDNLQEAVEALWERDKRVFDVMDILIATRKKDKKKFFDENGNFRLVHSLFQTPEGVMEFLEGTGLASVFRNSEIKDLVDYVFGVESV